METVLQMTFLTEGQKTSILRVDTPVDGLSDVQISTAMDTILAQNVLSTTSGMLQSKKGAQFVTKTVREVALT